MVSDSSSSSSSNNLRPVTDSPSKLPTVTVVVAEGGDTKNNDTQETGTAVLSRPVAIDDSPWYQDQVLLTTAQQQPVTNSFDTIEEESIANTSAIDIDKLSTLAIVDSLKESANATEPNIGELVVSSSVVTVVNFDNNNEQPSEPVAIPTQPTVSDTSTVINVDNNNEQLSPIATTPTQPTVDVVNFDNEPSSPTIEEQEPSLTIASSPTQPTVSDFLYH